MKLLTPPCAVLVYIYVHITLNHRNFIWFVIVMGQHRSFRAVSEALRPCLCRDFGRLALAGTWHNKNLPLDSWHMGTKYSELSVPLASFGASFGFLQLPCNARSQHPQAHSATCLTLICAYEIILKYIAGSPSKQNNAKSCPAVSNVSCI